MKASYYNNIITSEKNTSKTSQNILRNEMGKFESDKNIQTLFKIDNIILNTSQGANEFKNFFINVVDSLLAKQKNNKTTTHFLHATFQQRFPKMANIPIMDTEIVHTVNSINNKNSAGYDICNTSIIQGNFPDRLQYLIVVPVFKNGDRSQIANYRLISLITGFLKIFEILIYQQIIQHIQCHILVCEHCGFRKALSTDNTTIETIFDAWNIGKCIAGVFCNLTKALDCVNHELLVKNLEVYGIRCVLINWFKSYLDDRRQRINPKLFNLISQIGIM